jgi:8-oxo-dGTP diphosphatase
MKIRPGAYIEKGGRVLTLKYTYEGGEVYALPGGNLEFGEGLSEALERELHEELGLRCKVSALKHVAEVLYLGENTVHFIFSTEGCVGEPVLNPAETKAEEIVWLPLEQLCAVTLYPAVGSALQTENSPVHLGPIAQPRM